MYKTRKGSGYYSGFTLIEIIIVIGIMVVIFGIVFASISASKNKAADLEARKTLSELALNLEAKEIAPGVVDYAAAFDSLGGSSVLSDLANKYNFGPNEYEFQALAKSYAIVFPLKKGGYYCIDSAGRATGREVAGLFLPNDRDPDYIKSCDSATRAPIKGNIPVITIYGANPAFYQMYDDCRGNVTVTSYNEPGYSASDVEDGDLTGSVSANADIAYADRFGWQGTMVYSVLDSDGNSAAIVSRGLSVQRNDCPRGVGGGPILDTEVID